jgi:hypothetical protein
MPGSLQNLIIACNHAGRGHFGGIQHLDESHRLLQAHPGTTQEPQGPAGAARRFHLDSRGCRGVLLLAEPEQHAQVNPKVHSLLQDCAHTAARHFVTSWCQMLC